MKMTEKLDLLMKEKGLNRSELAAQADIPYMTIVNFYAKGTDNVKRSTLLKLAKFFDVSVDYLADDEVTKRNPPANILAAAAHLDLSDPEAIDEYNKFLEYLAYKYKDK